MKLVHIGNASGSYEALVLIDDETDPKEFLVGKDPTEEIFSVTVIDDFDLPGSLPTGYRMVKATWQNRI